MTFLKRKKRFILFSPLREGQVNWWLSGSNGFRSGSFHWLLLSSGPGKAPRTLGIWLCLYRLV